MRDMAAKPEEIELLPQKPKKETTPTRNTTNPHLTPNMPATNMPLLNMTNVPTTNMSHNSEVIIKLNINGMPCF
jgi:hypothetical protein